MAIYNNPRSNPPARVERWTLRPQQYDLIVKYRPGTDKPAEYCSIHPLATTETSRTEKMAEEYINFIVENASPIAIRVDDIKRETLQDAELQQVAVALHTGKWHKLVTNMTPDSPFRVYHKIKSELCTTPNRDIVRTVISYCEKTASLCQKRCVPKPSIWLTKVTKTS